MSITKRAFNNIFWLSMSEVSSKGLTFLGTIYLARVLGKAGFGLFSLSLAVGVYFWTASDLGVMGYGTRELARNKEKVIELYNLLNSLRFMLALSLFLLFGGILYFTNISLEKKLILLAGSFFGIAYSLSPDWVFAGIEKMQYIAFGRVVSALVFLASIFIFVKSPVNILSASIFYSSSFLLGSLILIAILYYRLKVPFSFRISFVKWWLHLKESFYFAINRAFNNISIFIPIFFMGIWSSPEDLGTFSAPHRLTTLIANAGGLAIMGFYPILSNLYITDRNAFKNTQVKFQETLIGISIPVCIIASLFSKEIVTFLFGSSYVEASGIFNILVWLSFLLLLRFSFGNVLLSAGFQRFNMLATGSGATITTLSSIIFIPRYSGYGAGLALISGEITSLILMSGLFRRKLYDLEDFKFYLTKVLLAGLAMALMIMILHFSMILGIIVGILVYGFLSLNIGIFSKKAIQQIYQELVKR